MSGKEGNKGRVIIVSGPSGVGKGTILRRLYDSGEFPIVPSVSATTRLPRLSETDGKDYHFLTSEQFEEKRNKGEFLECFEVFSGGHWYGTLRDEVALSLRNGKSVVLEIDVQGTREVLKTYPDALTVFIMPPSPQVLEKRLSQRGTEEPDARRKRLETALAEMRQSDLYKYNIVNDRLEEAVEELRMIFKKEIP